MCTRSNIFKKKKNSKDDILKNNCSPNFVFWGTAVRHFNQVFFLFFVVGQSRWPTFLLSHPTIKKLPTALNSKRIQCINRSCHSQMFFKKVVLENFAIFTGKHLWWSLFITKFIKKRLRHRCFHVNIATTTKYKK